jgi:hypothetical protein
MRDASWVDSRVFPARAWGMHYIDIALACVATIR